MQEPPKQISSAGGPVLNLVVLRSRDLLQAVSFYTCLGLRFQQHRHGRGPEHFSAEYAGGVFELYPPGPDGASTTGTRIGFKLASIDEALSALNEWPDAVVNPPRDSEWGRRAVVADPDGHRIELVE